ncbi:MAG: hypothetical protein BGO58_01645 [Sphingopyxis sp. 65-8]|nr:MAG: hypothetical protein BGO58_01645 [Sphingopyxis sp. 65-8]
MASAIGSVFGASARLPLSAAIGRMSTRIVSGAPAASIGVPPVTVARRISSASAVSSMLVGTA